MRRPISTRSITDNIDSAFTTNYIYDDYNRLINATSLAYSGNYQYDPWGNIKQLNGTRINHDQTIGAHIRAKSDGRQQECSLLTHQKALTRICNFQTADKGKSSEKNQI